MQKLPLPQEVLMISLGSKMIIILTMFWLSSCTSEGVKFDPDVYVGRNGYIINERLMKVMADEPRFLEYGCMHRDKWIELKEVLDRARIPKRKKRAASGLLNKVIKKIVK